MNTSADETTLHEPDDHSLNPLSESPNPGLSTRSHQPRPHKARRERSTPEHRSTRIATYIRNDGAETRVESQNRVGKARSCQRRKSRWTHTPTRRPSSNRRSQLRSQPTLTPSARRPLEAGQVALEQQQTPRPCDLGVSRSVVDRNRWPGVSRLPGWCVHTPLADFLHSASLSAASSAT